jgi:signal transduction histidine kinase
MERLASVEQRSQVVAQHQPPALVLSPGEEPARTVPVAVRALIGRVRQSRATARLAASVDQPLRASAGFVAENGLTWASWEDASEEVFERERQARVDRLDMLRELALTLNHEIGNSLVSLAALRHAEEHLPAPIREAIRIDVTRLETLNRELTYLAALSEPQIELVDLRELLQEVGSRCSVRIEIAPQPVPLAIARRLVDFALDSVIRAVTTNRGERGTKDLSVQLRSAGSGDALTALVSIKGGALELEGILPARTADSVPNQGNMGVFIAKEVIRLHGGSIHAGPGMEGTEILISLRKW